MPDVWVLNDVAPFTSGAQFETPPSEGAWGWFGLPVGGEGTEFQTPAIPWAPDFSVVPVPLWTAESGGGSPQIFAVGVAGEVETANAVTFLAGGVASSIGVATESDASNAVTLVPGAVSFAVGIASETDTGNVVTLVAGGVTVSIGVATETDTANAVTLSSPSVADEVQPTCVRCLVYHGVHEFVPNAAAHGAWDFGNPTRKITVR